MRAIAFIISATIHLSVLKENYSKEAEYESEEVADYHIGNIVSTDKQPNNPMKGYSSKRRDSSTREGKKHILVVLDQNRFFISTLNKNNTNNTPFD